MKKSTLYAIWGVFYIICAGLGFIPEPAGIVRGLMMVISVLFFVPPAILLTEARQTGDTKTLHRIRNLSILSLALTLILLIANILTAFGSTQLGNVLHVLLVLCSAPMFCAVYWVLSLFFWAALMLLAMRK